jgi:hypothetical protein
MNEGPQLWAAQSGRLLQAQPMRSVSRTAMFPVCVATVVSLAGVLFSAGFVGLAQHLSSFVVVVWMLIWIFRNSGSVQVAYAVVAARVATILIAVMFIEPHYLAAMGADSELYHSLGIKISQSLLNNGTLSAPDLAWGTENYTIYTGISYLLFGPTQMMAKIMNTGLAAIGSILFYKGYVSYYGRPRRALQLLLFFSPTLLYWSSIQGKDPLTFLFLGLGFWAVATIAKGALRKGLATALLAALGLFPIRPHVACLYLAAVSVMVIFRGRFSHRSTAISKLAPFLILGLVFLLAEFVAREYGHIEELSADTVQTQLSDQLTALDTGGSALGVPALGGWKSMLAYLPYGATAVLFRPFPWEGGNLFLKLTSLDQLFLTAAVISFAAFFLRNLRKSPSMARTGGAGGLADPMTLFLVAYCIGFVLIHTYTSGNLGTLARSKIQFSPFVWCGAFGLASRCRAIHAQNFPGAQRKVINSRSGHTPAAGRTLDVC